MSPSLPFLVPLLLALTSLSSATPSPGPRLADYPQHAKAKQALTLLDVSYSTVTSPATKVLPVLVVNAKDSVSPGPGGRATPLPDRTFIRWEPVTNIHPTLSSRPLHFGELGANSRKAQQADDKTYMWFAPKWLLDYYPSEMAPAPTEISIIEGPAGPGGLVYDSPYYVDARPTNVPITATRVEYMESLLATAAPVPIIVVAPVVPTMTPVAQVLQPVQEPEVFWREVKKDVVPITARIVKPAPPRTRLSRGPLRNPFSRLLHLPRRKQYREHLLPRSEAVELVPALNVPAPTVQPQTSKNGFRVLANSIASVAGWILLALLLGFAIVAVFYACCTPFFRYLWYGKKAIHVYKAYKAHREERKRRKEGKEAKKHGIHPIHTDVRHPHRAHLSKEKAPAPEVAETDGGHSWSSWRSNILHMRNPRVHRMMFPASWNTTPSVYEGRYDLEPHLTPSSTNKSASSGPSYTLAFGTESPPPLPPRPEAIYRIATPLSTYEYPSRFIFGGGVGDTIIRLWNQPAPPVYN